jgi:hypothetical protein
LNQVDATAPEAAFAWDGKIRIESAGPGSNRARSQRHTTRHYNYHRRVVCGAGRLCRMDCRHEFGFSCQTSVAPRQDFSRSTRCCQIGLIVSARFIGERHCHNTGSAHETSKRGAQEPGDLAHGTRLSGTRCAVQYAPPSPTQRHRYAAQYAHARSP